MVFAAIRLGLNTAFCKQIIVFQLFDHPVEVRYIVVAQWQHPQRAQSRHSVRQHGRQNLFAQLVHNDSSSETKIGLEYTSARGMIQSVFYTCIVIPKFSIRQIWRF